MKRKFSYLSFHAVLILLFLYVPLFLLIIYSFNASRLVTVWTGFSLDWYRQLWQDEQLMSAAVRSLQIAFTTALGSMILGTAAAFALARVRLARGKHLFSILLNTPLVLPDVILGFSLLLLFVTAQQEIDIPSQRGMLTIIIAHITLTTAYVATIVSTQLRQLDETIHLAAVDLGAKPWTVFWRITFPQIFPAVMSGGLLAFTLSFDDLVIASFVSGPDSTTLPMMIYSSLRLGVSPKINAVAKILEGRMWRDRLNT
jgi:putrescine transport system permease protein